MHATLTRSLAAGLAASLLAAAAGATQYLSDQGFPHPGEAVLLDFIGEPEDFIIPENDPPSQLRLSVTGARGGGANPYDNHCEAYGGRGAQLTADFLVGYGADELAPGGTLRFIVGGRGETQQHDKDVAAGGGGGGTGVIYRASSSDPWIPLLVGGGGGGAAQETFLWICFFKDSGRDASLTPCSTDGNGDEHGEGGCAGNQGTQAKWTDDDESLQGGGGGGGAYSTGGNPTVTGGPGIPLGGYGVGSGDDGIASGGWGFGAGGVGRSKQDDGNGAGGGGGYSGGGGGGATSNGSRPYAGGGGGSYMAPFGIEVSKAINTNGEHDGSASLYSHGSGSICSKARPLYADPGQTVTTVVHGTIADAIPSVDFSPVFGFNNAGPDVWYSYTNDLPIWRDLTFKSLSPIPLYIEHHWQCPVYLDDDGDLSAPEGVTFTVPANTTRYFRIETSHAGFTPDMPFSMEVTYEALGTDTDGDGVADLFDLCAGDDSQDADQDGIPDACDPCTFLAGPDCDGNGIQDACDLGFPKRFTWFNEALLPDTVTVLGMNDFTPGLANGRLRVGGHTTSAALGTVHFEPVSPTPIDAFGAYFYARFEPGLDGANGLSFCVYDADQHNTDQQLGLFGPADGLTLRLMPQGTISPTLDVELRWAGQLVASTNVDIDLSDGVWRRISVEFLGGGVAVGITEWGQIINHILSDVQLPGFEPYRMRYGFATQSVSGGFDPEILVDEVTFEDWSGDFERDIDNNGVLDACQPVPYQLVKGAPANPKMFFPELGEAPVMGWPYVVALDHTWVDPNATMDMLLVSNQLIQSVIEPHGTLMVPLPAISIHVGAPEEPFELPIPYHTELLGKPLVLQGVSIDPQSAAVLRFTNAIQTEIGGWRPSL